VQRPGEPGEPGESLADPPHLRRRPVAPVHVALEAERGDRVRAAHQVARQPFVGRTRVEVVVQQHCCACHRAVVPVHDLDRGVRLPVAERSSTARSSCANRRGPRPECARRGRAGHCETRHDGTPHPDAPATRWQRRLECRGGDGTARERREPDILLGGPDPAVDTPASHSISRVRTEPVRHSAGPACDARLSVAGRVGRDRDVRRAAAYASEKLGAVDSPSVHRRGSRPPALARCGSPERLEARAREAQPSQSHSRVMSYASNWESPLTITSLLARA
jgi:hypothetical protein